MNEFASPQNSLARAQKLEARETYLTRRASRFQARVRWHQSARLTVAGLFFLGLFVGSIRPEWHVELPAVLILGSIFAVLVVRTSRLKGHVRDLERLRAFCQRQRLRLQGRPSGRSFESAAKFASLQHEPPLLLARDLGLLGQHSLLTLIDETLTDQGEKKLLHWMNSRPPAAELLVARQERIRLLRGEAWFYTRLTLLADPDAFRLSSTQVIDFLKKPFVADSFAKLLVADLVAWVLMLLGIVGFATGALSVSPALWVVLFAVFNFWCLGQNDSLFRKGLGLETHLNLLAPIFDLIEKRTQRSKALQSLMPVSHEAGPSRETRKLTLVLSLLGVETNPLLNLLINAALPWSMVASHLLEKRRQTLAANFPRCLEELAELEAIGSLILLDRYQTRTYPTFRSAPHFEARQLFHPLIPRESVVANDFVFSPGKTLGLLTGSNMAGKSTFLRTVGLNQTLAQMGAPVFASDYVTHPYWIETCIEVSDSLRDGYSYFYAEVRRLRDLLQASDTGAPVLYLIDEIFRGTNNRERHIGSRAVIRHLARNNRSHGFISTHDLELVALEQTEPGLLNLHFRENFEAGRMVFHYRLHPGPCPTTNALKIMQAEGIQVDES